MANPVVHFEIAGKDARKTREFYSELFGWEFQSFDNDYVTVAAASKENAIGGGVFQARDFPPYATFYVAVESLEATLKQVESLGGKTIVPPMPIPGMGAFAMFHDIDGNLIGIFQSKE